MMIQADETSPSIIPITEWPVSNAEISESRNVVKRKGAVSNEEHNRKIGKTAHSLSLSLSQSQRNASARLVASVSAEECPLPLSGFTYTSSNETQQPHDFDCVDKEHDITAKIARWWRRRRIQGFGHSTPKCGPNSMLQHISRLPECRTYLNKERRRLLGLMEMSGKKADIYAALASLDDIIGDISSAYNFIKQAVHYEPSCPEYLWLREKISRQCWILRKQSDARTHIEKKELKFPSIIEVPRVSGKDLSVSDFQKKYLAAGKPVIITDSVDGMTNNAPFDYSLIIKHAGNATVTTKEAACDSLTWAKLENKRETTVAELIKGIQAGSVNDFLFDWSLPLHCPSLAEEISLPLYFKNNLLLQTVPGSLYRESWPSLFIAPKGAKTELHVDAFNSHFWMALFQGEKRWTFFDKRDTALLYPRLFQSMDPVFEVDLNQPDLEKFPLLALTQPQQCILCPGELLFVPAGSPHYVENLTSTLAISSNYVDHTNIQKVCEELKINGLQDQRAKDLLLQLQDPAFLSQSQMNKEI